MNDSQYTRLTTIAKTYMCVTVGKTAEYWGYRNFSLKPLFYKLISAHIKKKIVLYLRQQRYINHSTAISLAYLNIKVKPPHHYDNQ